MKECIKCHRLLPLNDKFFALRSDSPDGFRNDCKECVKKRRSEWRCDGRLAIDADGEGGLIIAGIAKKSLVAT